MPPTYEFACSKCDKNFETIESITTYDGDGDCPTCGNNSKERILCSRVMVIGAKVQSAEFNPAFGQIVKNKHHRNELAKERGLVEIGNDKPESTHKAHEKERADRIKKRWENV